MIVHFSHDQIWKIVTIYSCITANVFRSDGGCARGVVTVVIQRMQILPLALALRSRMKQEIGNVKIIIE